MAHGILGDDTDEFNGDPANEPRACFEIENTDTGEIARYYLTSAQFGARDGATPPGIFSELTGIDAGVPRPPVTADRIDVTIGFSGAVRARPAR